MIARYGLATLFVCLAPPALAHDVQPKAVRELVRAQGYRAPAPQGTAVQRELTVIALGQQVAFAVTAWRVFAFADTLGTEPAEPAQVVLQGERALLRRFTTARPDQQVTILAERRPGGHDLFVLEIDLCPAR